MTTRRAFLQGMGAAGMAVGFLGCGGGGAGGSGGTSSGGGTEPPGPPARSNILVLVQLQGGNDLLSTVVPTSGTQASRYASARPTLGLGSALLDLGNGLGATRNLLGFDKLQAAGRLAWIPGVGMQNPNLSHFTSTDVWGMGSASPDSSGWLGRWGDAVFGATDVLRGISLTSDILLMARGHKRDFVGITSTGDVMFPAYLRTTAAVPDAAVLDAGYGLALGAAAGDLGVRKATTEGQLWYDAQARFRTLIKARTPSVPYPGDAAFPVTGLSTQLSSQLKLVAQMIASDIPAQVYTVRLGGFDTHSNQLRDHPRLMASLGGALSAFYDDLASITSPTGTAQDRVAVLVWSEFGRRVKENNGGTDHGAAGLALALGKPVKGGIYGGGFPDLGDLDAYGNLKFTTDFRSLYSTLIDRWLGGDSRSILGSAYPNLAFL